jgi:hypothetical protein
VVQEVQVTPSYTIKKKEVQVTKKETVLWVFMVEIGANTQLNTPAAKANLLFQNKRKCDFSKLWYQPTIG